MTNPSAVTVVEAVDRISHNQLLLPGVQRNFVWQPRQIAKLFDSLFNDYK